MQASTGCRARGKEQKSLLGRVCTAAAYCRNVNPPNVLQLEEKQDHRLNWAFRAHRGGGRTSGKAGEKVRGSTGKATCEGETERLVQYRHNQMCVYLMFFLHRHTNCDKQ